MKATHIGKTILVWNELSDKQASRVITALKDIISKYRLLTNNSGLNRPIPIALKNDNNYLCLIKKHNEIFVCSTKISNNKTITPYVYNAIINIDFLYKSIEMLENAFDDLQSHIDILQRFPNTEWIKLPFNKAFEDYCLSPNINPENFIKNLERGTLSEMSKQFLRDVGFALEDSEFSEDLQKTITEANEIFFER